MQKIKWLKKYMKIEYLKNTLESKQLFLGDPNCWEDKNDNELIKIYKCKKKLSDIRVTCLTLGPDRFHFWKIFGGENTGVCLWFDKTELLADIKKDNNLRAQKVSYYTPYKLAKKCNLDDLPFAKREQYRDENEFRVLREYTETIKGKSDGITFNPSSLKRIYFNAYLCNSQYSKQRKEIEEVIQKNNYDIEIKQNKILRFQKWIEIAKKVK